MSPNCAVVGISRVVPLLCTFQISSHLRNSLSPVNLHSKQQQCPHFASREPLTLREAESHTQDHTDNHWGAAWTFSRRTDRSALLDPKVIPLFQLGADLQRPIAGREIDNFVKLLGVSSVPYFPPLAGLPVGQVAPSP